MKQGRVANLQKSLVQSAELVMLDLEAIVGVHCFVNLVTGLLHVLDMLVMEAILCAHYVLL